MEEKHNKKQLTIFHAIQFGFSDIFPCENLDGCFLVQMFLIIYGIWFWMWITWMCNPSWYFVVKSFDEASNIIQSGGYRTDYEFCTRDKSKILRNFV